MKRRSMYNPAHPGEIVRDACLKPLKLSVTAAANAFGITPKALRDVINCRCGISADMALRLEQAFGIDAETWLRMQNARDLWQARSRAATIKVNRRFFSRALAAAGLTRRKYTAQ